jgi:3-hydroxybutyryl-CoA dehydrogenase
MGATELTAAVVGAGRIGRQIALAFALGGWPVRLRDVKERPRTEADAVLADARREIERDLGLMVDEAVVKPIEATDALARIECGVGLDGLGECAFVQEALPELLDVKRGAFARLKGRVSDDAIIASASSTISPRHLADAVSGPERFLVAHWLNPAHIIPLVEVVAGAATTREVVERTLALLERLGKTPVRCGDSPGFIGPRLQVLLMNEAVRLVEEGVATPEDVDRAFRAGMGFRYASVGIFEFIDWGGVDILQRASRFMTEATGDARFAAARLVDEKIARNELGPKTGRGFFEYAGERRDAFESAKVRALLRQLKAWTEERHGSAGALRATGGLGGPRLGPPSDRSYFRAVDPYPLESADHNKLAEFYRRLGEGRLSTTRCTGCARTAWPPRGFCSECASDQFEWIDLPAEGTIHAFTVQEAGLPTGFTGPRVFAIVKVDGHRVFSIVVDADPASVRTGQNVRLRPLRVEDDPKGEPRWLPAFTPVEEGARQ